ncbi:acyl carrier protein [Bariatricus massiliensis]|uniref:Acyl carrier protein n=1 Tax=Bariatricus massiliensis TaxID=1745713 RepID=A0ABS8DD96_9FIRM|nr:acyl carrier protein [Bariatricus massiliensis]MCB7302504.1 acyl carrier protein [Bariatricus massiliensis]MCB7373720.1 acyl carrier protein [Bariatricus massiliensis]MCB7386390.1 acyl carrier protein [Bariatricus massiliensis]MCB7410552.1 acyl carrier protein [Bariatricus massiliensis]MCQ5253611.1 acyl carrier protein [Bariatricus massiliensis]
MLEKVKNIVAEGLGVDVADLAAETTFESLGADSLDLMDMVMSFEDEFGVEIDTEAIGGLKTIGDVVVYIEGLQK